MATTLKFPEKNGWLYYASQNEGIYFSMFDEASGKVSPPVQAAKIPSSFFLARHLSKPVLYSLDASARRVTAFAMASDGSLSEINRVDSQGDVACHLVVEERFVAVANYGGGISLFPLRSDGGLAEVSSIYPSTSSGPRQGGSKPHGLAWLPGKNIVYLTDLGADLISVFRIEDNRFVPISELATKVQPGAGPRHIVLHPEFDSALVVNELNNTVTSFALNPTTGQLSETDMASTLPPGFKDESWAAEVGYHPRANVCYASNRGQDTLAIFSIERGTGKLHQRQIIEGGGKWPQHFTFDSSGATLFVANTKSDAVALHRIDPETGLYLEKIGDIPVSQPMCVLLSAPR